MLLFCYFFLSKLNFLYQKLVLVKFVSMNKQRQNFLSLNMIFLVAISSLTTFNLCHFFVTLDVNQVDFSTYF